MSGLQRLGYKSGGNLNKGQINIGLTEIAADCFINILKSASVGFSGGATPDVLDSTGYPSKSFTGIVSCTLNGTLPSTGPYVLKWPAGRAKFKIIFTGATATTSATSNCTVQNNGSNNFGITGDGTSAGSATFTFSSAYTSLQVNFDGNSGAQAYAAGSGDMVLMLVSEQSNYDAGEIFTQSFIDALTDLGPKCLRMMPVINTGNSNANSTIKWKYRVTPQDISWRRRPYRAETYAGNITAAGTGQYPSSADQMTAPAASDTPLTGWVDGEEFTGNVQTAVTGFSVTGIVSGTGGNCKVQVTQSTANLAVGQSIWLAGIGGTTEAIGIHSIVSVDDSSHFTIDVPFVHTWSSNGSNVAGVAQISVTGKSGGSKFVANNGGAPVTSLSTGLTGFHYDALLDVVIQCEVTGSLPVEIQCAMANRFKADLWSNIGCFADDDYVRNWATTIRDNLRPAACFFVEYSNEMQFNSAFPQWAWAYNSGTALGFSNPAPDFYVYKIKKLLGDIVGPFWQGRKNQLRRVLTNQYVPSAVSTNTWKGTHLSAYGYDVSPNRPIDCVECVAYAPYAGGRNLSLGADLNFNPASAQAPWYQALVDAWDAGDTATAIALVDDDIRQGRHSVQNVTASGGTFTTPLDHGFTANSTCVQFQVTDGTTYSGLATNQVYLVTSTPTTKTFTVKDVSGASVDAGSAGDGVTTVGNAGKAFNPPFMTCWTIVGYANTVTPFWETTAASFDSDRPAGMDSLKVLWYEGALEIVGPSSAQLSSLGVTGTNPAASITAAITAWKNADISRETYIAYCRQFMGTDPAQVTYGAATHSHAISNLTLGGGSQYAFLSGGIASDRFKAFDGFANFSKNG